MPEEAIDELRASDMFAELVGLAQTTSYDNWLVTTVSTPTPAMLAIRVPMTILRGDPIVPLITAAERLAQAIPGAELVVVPESHDHSVDHAGPRGRFSPVSADWPVWVYVAFTLAVFAKRIVGGHALRAKPVKLVMIPRRSRSR